MEFESDEVKRIGNLHKHGVDFATVRGFEWGSAQESEDRRPDYGEGRWISRGRIGGQLHVLIYTRRHGRIRVISLREASRREKANYAKNET